MEDSFVLRNRAKEWYFNNPDSTLVDVATEFDIPFETVRDWSRNENWSDSRDVYAGVPEITGEIKAEAVEIRHIVFSRIKNEDMSPKDMGELIKAWRSMVSMTSVQRETSRDLIDRDELDKFLNEPD